MVYIILGKGFEPMEAIAPCDILRRGGAEVRFAGIGGTLIEGGHGISVQADCTVEQMKLADTDMVLLPGGLGGVHSILASETAMNFIRLAYEKNCLIAAICAAPMVLGALGIVKDRHATIYPGIEDKLIGAAPLTDEVVVDGNVITSRAPGTAIPFAIALAELLTDEKTAAALTEDLVFRKA